MSFKTYHLFSLYILFFVGAGISNAQTKPVVSDSLAVTKTITDSIPSNKQWIDTTSIKVVKKGLPSKTIQITDTLKSTYITESTNNTEFTIKTKDSVIFLIKDQHFAKNADSIWIKELFNTKRFKEAYEVVTNDSLEPVEYKELSTEILKQRLKELDARTPFNVEYNPSLEIVIKRYLKNRRKSLQRLMNLSAYYFPMFEQEFDRNNIPLELKYLAIVESALVPTAQSRVGAKGLWQFMFTTGKHFGLDVSSYVDERSDPVQSTKAASKYLKKLNKSFNDWDLALAAYNSGPGNVSKAIRRSGGETNYWKIRHNLPRETAGYLPAFLATMYIFEYAEEHGFNKGNPIFHQIATDTVQVKQLITLEQVAKVVNLPLEEVEFLNPSYKLGIIPYVKEKKYAVRLPVASIGKFVANEEEIYAFAKKNIQERSAPLPKYTKEPNKIRYRVKSGDYLGKIANKYGVRVSQIKRWNHLRNNNLRIGQRLTIYPKTSKSTSKKTKKKKTVTNTKGKTYIVQKGDSLWSISQKFPGVTIQKIKDWNDIGSSKLKPGMKLKIL